MSRTTSPSKSGFAPEDLTNNPDAREQAVALNRPTPSNTSVTPPGPSRTRTELDVPEPESPHTRESILVKLYNEQYASCPRDQWWAQFRQERIEVENEIDKSTLGGCVDAKYAGCNYDDIARERLKARWVEQGIWREEWPEMPPIARWKHRDPLESEPPSDSESDSAAPLRLKSDQDRQEAAERRELRKRTRERERNASRPFEQFLYQLQRESRRLEAIMEDTVATNMIINALAFRNVQQTWIRWRIWDDSWCGFPGMLWRHERRLIMPRGQPQLHENPLEPSVLDASHPLALILPSIEYDATPPHNLILQSIENDSESTYVDVTSCPMGVGSSRRRQSRPAPTASSKGQDVEQDAATRLKSNSVIPPSDAEPMTVRKTPISSPRRSKRLQNRARETSVPFPKQTLNPLRQTSRQPAGASKPQGIRKRCAQSKPRKQTKNK